MVDFSKMAIQGSNILKAIIHSSKSAEFIRFCIVGGIATGIHYGIYLCLIYTTNINTNIAYTIGYVLSFLGNLYLTSRFTFKKKLTATKCGGFALSHGINYCLHILFLNIFLWLGVAKQWAPIPTYCIVVPINFMLVRFVFNKL